MKSMKCEAGFSNEEFHSFPGWKLAKYRGWSFVFKWLWFWFYVRYGRPIQTVEVDPNQLELPEV